MQNNHSAPSQNNYALLFILIASGEIIFSLPFHIARFFRPTFLEAFQLSNTQLGDIFAVYGVTAMLAYFPGGMIADYFNTRKLMSFSLLATALGGFYMATIPSVDGLYWLFAYWGITSILLFWAALIRATRAWGSELNQGKAFGLLDGGRGLIAALLATTFAQLLVFWLPTEQAAITASERIDAIRNIIYLYTFVTLVCAAAVFYFLPEQSEKVQSNPFAGLKEVLGQRFIWLFSVIIVAAYCGYKSIDNYGVYAVQVLNMSEAEAAQFTSSLAYIRPAVAILAGVLVDRLSATKVINSGFIVLIASYLLMLVSSEVYVVLLLATLMVTCLAIFALRAVYFALLQQANIPPQYTGTAVGIVSVVGFTPDIFFGSVTGRILDSAEPATAFNSYFVLMLAISVTGLICAWICSKKLKPAG